MGTPFASETTLFRPTPWNRAPLFIFAAALLLGGAFVPRVRAEISREYDLKAVLLFNLTRFVEWPPAAFGAPESPLIIGILGQDPYGKTLDDVVRTERYGTHRILVVRYRSVEAVENCQILFVCGNEQPNLPRILKALAGRPVLTVGEFEGFATGGGMVRLYQNTDGKIRLRINLGAVRATGLTVSGKLLRVAETVNAEGN